MIEQADIRRELKGLSDSLEALVASLNRFEIEGNVTGLEGMQVSLGQARALRMLLHAAAKLPTLDIIALAGEVGAGSAPRVRLSELLPSAALVAAEGRLK
jgi:hypothetical protein